MQRYLSWAARTPVLVTTGVLQALLVLVVLPNVPVIGGQLIDLLPSYSYDEIFAKLTSYGEEGRRLHAIATPTLDTLFPIIYVTFFAGLIHRLRPAPWHLALIPIGLGLWDLGENAQITAMCLQYPDLSRTLVASASFFTMIKHNLVMLTLLTVAALALLRLFTWLRRS